MAAHRGQAAARKGVLIGVDGVRHTAFADSIVNIGWIPTAARDRAASQIQDLAPPVGLEPTTQRLTVACSTD